MDRDGIETVGIVAGVTPIQFDHNADGIKTGTGWLKSDDAWLVLDHNDNGTIDSGQELFGVDTQITVNGVTRKATTGFEALASLDSSGDKLLFNVADEAFTQVRLWQDFNQDGISQAGELSTLADKGIISISLAPSTIFNDLGNGNVVTGKAVVNRTTGTTEIDSVDLGGANNLDLADNPFYRQFTDTIPLTEAAKGLPQMQGSGWARDLREAMSLGNTGAESLTTAVQAFAGYTTRADQLILVRTLLESWAASTGQYDSPDLIEAVSESLVSETATSRTYHVTTMDPAHFALLSGTSSAYTAMKFVFNDPQYIEKKDGLNQADQLTAAGGEVLRRRAVLEVFNGRRFVDFTTTRQIVTGGSSGSSGGSGGGGGAVTPPSGPQVRYQITLANEQIGFINAAYEALRESVYAALVIQTRLQPYLDSINLVIDDTGIRFDLTAMNQRLEAAKAADPKNALIDLIELNRYSQNTLAAVGFDGLAPLRAWIEQASASSWLADTLADLHVFPAEQTGLTTATDIYLGSDDRNNASGGDGDDILDGAASADVLSGEAGRDSLYGGSGDDRLYGGADADSLRGDAGDDFVYGDAGDDVLDGSVGNDYLEGGDGADTYLFGIGSGHDTIGNADGDAVGVLADTILLGAGIAPTDVLLTRSADDLMIAVNGTDDRLKVKDYFYQDGASNKVVEHLRFADGTAWSIATVKAKVLVQSSGNDYLAGYAEYDSLHGGAGNDSLRGGFGNDTLLGGTERDELFGDDGDDLLQGEDGKDQLSGGAGNDILLGGAGNDLLSGGAGNDTLDGGAGNDNLQGGGGSDTYLFGKGSGQDTIHNISSDNTATSSDVDMIELGEGIATTGVVLKRNGANLVISLKDTADRLELSNYFSYDGIFADAVDGLKFKDGNVWDAAMIKTKVLVSTPGDDSLIGYASDDVLSGGDGRDDISGYGGNDTLLGGAGGDVLHGYSGDDSLNGEAGNDWLQGYDGADILLGGAGQDTLYGYSGNDTLDGGAGNDSLRGGDGADTYLFGRGSGRDRIENYDSDAVGTNLDEIVLAAGIATTDVILTRSADNLLIAIKGTDDVLEVVSYFSQDNAYGDAVDTLRFNDGTTWNYLAVKSRLTTVTTVGVNLPGTTASEELTGSAGNDTIYAGTGNDTLDGGAGNDRLSGDAGNDTYLFGRGAGQDVVNNYDTAAEKLDVVQLGAGIATTDVSLTRDGSALVLVINGTADRLRMENYFAGDGAGNYRIEQIKFAGGTGTVWDVATVKAKVINPTDDSDLITGYATADSLTGQAGDDRIDGGSGNDTLDGGAGYDSLQGGLGHDVLIGGAQSDTLSGDMGDDTLDGGAGDDFLNGGGGNDSYLFGRGSGNDTINSPDMGGEDIVQLGAGISSSDVTLLRDGMALILTINGTADSLRIESYFQFYTYYPDQVDQIKFADNMSTVWDVATVKSKVMESTNGDDLIIGYETADFVTGQGGDDRLMGDFGNDTLDGGAGGDELNGGNDHDVLRGGAQSDTLYGAAGDDSLLGQEDDDNLSGGEGNDTLDGGAGNDTLRGDGGNDTYLFGRGSGKDLINASRLDAVQLGAGIATTDVMLRKDGNSLMLTINGTADSLRFSNYFVADDYKVDQIKFADSANTIWDMATVKSKAMVATDGDDDITGYEAADSLMGHVGEDSLHGQAGNDTLDGGGGEDYLEAGEGDDVLRGGAQNDTLVGDAGNDSLLGQEGADVLRGGMGDDLYVVESALDTISEFYEEGYDRVESSVSYTLGIDVEQLTLTGSDNIGATGNSSNNVLVGNDAGNLLNGKGGADTMRGGLGGDIYIVDNAGDVIVEQGLDYDYVESSVSYVLSDGFESLTLTGTAHLNGTGNALSNELIGNDGNNYLMGGDGNDYLEGGLGLDSLEGGAGNDVYRVDNVDDEIIESLDPSGGTDTMWTSVDNAHMYEGIERLYLDGGTAIKATGSYGNDLIQGNGANNRLYGLEGDDKIYGNAGDDWIWSAGGNDSVTGGAGNDTLTDSSSTSNDVYSWGRGGGNDKVIDYGGAADRLVVSLVSDKSQLWFQQVGTDLRVSVIGSGDFNAGLGDSMTLANWFDMPQRRIETITVGAATLSDTKVQALVNAMAEFVPPAAGQTTLPSHYQAALNPVIASSWA